MRPSPVHKGFRSAEDKLASHRIVDLKNRDAQAPKRTRASGSRNVFSTDFVRAFHEDFLLHGADVIREVREKAPVAYLATATKIIPQHIQLNTNPFDGLDENGVRGQLRSILDELASFGALPETERPGITIEGATSEQTESVRSLPETTDVP